MAQPPSQQAMLQQIPFVDGQWEVDYLRESDRNDFFELSGEVFCEQNAIIKHIGISKHDWHIFEEHDSMGAFESGFSLVTRDKNLGNQVVAFIAVHQFSFAKPQPVLKKMGMEHPEKLEQFFDAMTKPFLQAYLCSCYDGCCAAFTGRTLRIVAGGTRKGYEGKKLQVRMRQLVLEMAEAKGYDRVVVETISPATEHIWKNKFGFRVNGEMTFKEYKAKDGSMPYEGVEGKGVFLEKVFRKRPCIDQGCWCPCFCCGASCKHLCCGQYCQYMCCCFKCS